MSDPLAKLFSSSTRVKLLRLFLFNPSLSFTVAEAARRARIPEREARKEMTLFASIQLIEKARRGGKSARFVLRGDFAYLAALQGLLLNASVTGGDLYERLRHAGVVKLLMLSGIFLGEWERRLDILIVADKVKERLLKERIRRLESEIGRELRFAVLSTDDFFYRLSMNDHLLRDVIDYPHAIIYDRLNIGLT